MEEIQQVSIRFFVPLVLSYASAGAGGFLLFRYYPQIWPRVTPPRPEREWLDFALVFVTAAVILALGQAYRAGYLLPRPSGPGGSLVWNLNNFVIYSPLFVTLIVRQQSLATAYLSFRGIGARILVGLILGVVSVLLFTSLRGELDRLPTIAVAAFQLKSVENFFPVFLEGLALAFALVRLRWCLGTPVALILPSALFALAHVPSQIQNGRTLTEMAGFFLLTGGIAVALLYTIQKTRDIVWLGIVHYLMDIAIHAF